MSNSLVVNEIYLSLQGESTFAGLPCIFIRLTGCNLRCSYCDTAYAFHEGDTRPVESILEDIHRLGMFAAAGIQEGRAGPAGDAGDEIRELVNNELAARGYRAELQDLSLSSRKDLFFLTGDGHIVRQKYLRYGRTEESLSPADLTKSGRRTNCSAGINRCWTRRRAR